MTESAAPILELENVSVTYRRPGHGRLTAVDNVSLQLSGGEVLGLVGESGCGKSTTARAVCGLEPVSAGRILFQGREVEPLSFRKRRSDLLRIQMVFQNPYASLNPRRTVGSQIADGLRLNPDQTAWSVADLLDRVGLGHDDAKRYSHEFSGGQRQRIAIARAIATGPELLIGDEPIASLDASLQATIAALMKDLAIAAGSALLFISHDLAVVRTIADRVAVMQQGKIVEQGPTRQVWTTPQSAYTRRLLASIPVPDGLGILPGLVPVPGP